MQRHEERAFFEAFDAALKGDPSAMTAWIVPEHDAGGLAVYRNTIVGGAVDALTATFSTVVMMTGEDWFRAAARVFAQEHPPREPALISYGAEFPDWIADFGPAADASYLGDIARMDWLWWQAWSAADAPLLDGAELAELVPEGLGDVSLGLHPSVRIAAFDTATPSLWLAHQGPARDETHVLGEAPERILFVRLGAQVEARLVDAAAYAFVAALARSASLLKAAEAAVEADADCLLQQILVTGLALGLFTHLVPIQRNVRHDQ